MYMTEFVQKVLIIIWPHYAFDKKGLWVYFALWDKLLDLDTLTADLQ